LCFDGNKINKLSSNSALGHDVVQFGTYSTALLLSIITFVPNYEVISQSSVIFIATIVRVSENKPDNVNFINKDSKYYYDN